MVLHDLRLGSPTDGATLCLDMGEIDGGENNHLGVFIPPGVAHGFASLTDMAITYLVDSYYNPADERGVAWDDPAIAADWRLNDPILSERDRTNPRRADIEPMWQPHARTCGPEPTTPRTTTIAMQLFVTGGAGFIGSNFVHHVLGTSDDSVMVFDALTYAGNLENLADLADNPRFRFVQGDICDRAAVRSRHGGLRAVVHFAAESHVDRSLLDPDVFVRTNCDGTNVMCDIAAQLGVERFVHISTDEVYGSIEEGSFVETDRLRHVRRTRRPRPAPT